MKPFKIISKGKNEKQKITQDEKQGVNYKQDKT